MGLPIDLFICIPDPNLLCPICQDVLDDPSSLQCGHLFCRSCLLSYQEIKSNPQTQNKGGGFNHNGDNKQRNKFSFKGVSIVCPTCRHIDVTEDESKTSHSIIKNIIDNLQIKCKNRHHGDEEMRESNVVSGNQQCERGVANNNKIKKYASIKCCEWKGKLCEYKSHAESTCELELVTCQAPDCNDRLMRGCMRSGYCNKSECAIAIARKYITGKKADFMSLKKEVFGMNDNVGNNGFDKENESRNEACSLLTGKAVQLCLEADKILSKPYTPSGNHSDNLSTPPKPRVTKTIHDNDLLLSPRPWVTKNTNISMNKSVSFAPSSLNKDCHDVKTVTKDLATDDTAKRDHSSGLDMIKPKNKQLDQNENNSAFVMAAVKVLVDKEMSRIRQQNMLQAPMTKDPPTANGDGQSPDSIRAIFVHRYLMDFCRSWMQHKPDALHDFVIYRPKMSTTSRTSFHNYINKLLCGIPGPKRTGWDGGLFPVLIEWNDMDMPPKCRFPRDFHHANVQPSGQVSLSTLKNDWHPEITIPEILFDLQQLLAHPNHDDSAQPEARASYRSGMYDFKTMIQTSVYVPRSDMASGVDGFGGTTSSSWQLVDGEALSRRSGVRSTSPLRPKEPTFTSSQSHGRSNACQSYCSCCAWGQTLWCSKREMRYLFGRGGS